MAALCPACASGPGGFEGHTELMAQAIGDARMSFRCRRCHAFWLRTVTVSSKGFSWVPSSEQAACSSEVGAMVPPRSTDPAWQALVPPPTRALPHAGFTFRQRVSPTIRRGP
jgi:hypothetical protein